MVVLYADGGSRGLQAPEYSGPVGGLQARTLFPSI
jgi:hypothetical protein